MRKRFLETLCPVCPVCRAAANISSQLAFGRIDHEDDDHVIDGVLICSNGQCQREYPIIDGIPLIIRDLRAYISENVFQIFQRDDYSNHLQSLIGDCCGPESLFNVVRQHLSSYTWDHYAEFDPDENEGPVEPGMIKRLLESFLEDIAPEDTPGPIIDIGCSVGRCTFELAETFDRPVLGIDLNFPMLQVAARALRTGTVRYPRRRVGVVYDQRSFNVDFPNRANVDFWACDALALPFAEHQFAAAISMNVIDCISSPMDFLLALESLLRPNAKASIVSPYDWSSNVTAIESWLGGHSQRGPEEGASEPALRRALESQYLQSRLKIVKEFDAPWQVRMHERSCMSYLSHVSLLKRDSSSSANA